MQTKRIVLLAGEWDSTPVVYNFLQKHFGVVAVIVEKPVPRKQFLRNRMKRLGLVSVAGQVLFQLMIAKPLRKVSEKRVQRILVENQLSDSQIPQEKLITVQSVNDDYTLKHLREIKPDLVVVHGTRIIAKHILQNTSATFLNIHAGITPRYRGSHGAYWAMVNDDIENCGVTVHVVDAGIDTGGIVAQDVISITNQDNFSTYPYLQLAKGLQLLKRVIAQFFSGEMTMKKNSLNSALWHHPTLWYYLYKRLTRRVK